MSFNVLVIPEDFRKDQYILRPIIEAMLDALKVKAKVRVCQEPLLGGVTEALNWDRIQEVLARYPMVHCFLLVVDRDGKKGRRAALDRLEAKVAEVIGPSRYLIGENAWQEVEVWALAGLDLPKKWSWKDVRAEKNSKEIYFEPIAEDRGLLEEPGQGRKTLGREAAANYKRVRTRCREDVAELEGRIKKARAATAQV